MEGEKEGQKKRNSHVKLKLCICKAHNEFTITCKVNPELHYKNCKVFPC